MSPSIQTFSKHSSAVVVFLAAAVLSAACAHAGEPRDWDRALPGLELRDVKLSAGSLEEAWQQLSTRYLARSILYVRNPANTRGAFRFECSRCRVREALDALVRAYPDFAWTADAGTGVLWVHPKSSWNDLLPQRLRISRDYCAIPLQSGVLAPLGATTGANVVPAHWGTAFSNTFNVAVDVPAGDHRLRDLLSMVVKEHPTKTFYIRSVKGREELTPVHLGSDKLTRPAPGALLWWRLHLGVFSGAAPTPKELVRKLSASSPEDRDAAREYLEAVAWQVDLDALVTRVPGSPVERAWAALGVTSVVARIPQATHQASRQELGKLLAGGVSGSGARPVALLAGIERARLAGERLPAASTSPADLEPILRDLLRLSHLYEPARVLFQEGKIQELKKAAKEHGKRGTDRCLGSLAGPWQSAVAYELLQSSHP